MFLTKKKIAPAHIRWMIRRDMQEVCKIDNAIADLPLIEKEFLDILRKRNCIGLVAEIGDKVVGYMIHELHRDRFNIVRLGVDPQRQQKGVGAQLVNKLIGKLHPDRRIRITAEVHEEHLHLHLFLKHVGFRATGVFKDHFGRGEDAYFFQYSHKQERHEPR